MKRRRIVKLVDGDVLRYGENPHQTAVAWGLPGIPRPVQHHGKPQSLTNKIDLDAAYRIVFQFDEPAAAVIKHTGPCGVAALDASTAAVYILAREADRKSAYGGVVALNRRLDVDTAREISRTFIECVIAPEVDDDALEILRKKEDLRVVTCDPSVLQLMEMRTALGELLEQDADQVLEARGAWDDGRVGPDPGQFTIPTKRGPTGEEWAALRFAWRVCAFVKSNAVVLTGGHVTLGLGGGRPNRHDSSKIARGYLGVQFVPTKQGEEVVKVIPPPVQPWCVGASDAFFPKRDGLLELAYAGATAVVHPGGSKQDAESIEVANDFN